MSPESRDLTIESVLADPIILAAMKADRVNPRDLETLLRATARRIEPAPQRKWAAMTAFLPRQICGADRDPCLA
ncbi:hypothetical protein [Lichenifustis flavocetrariae]|uniref:Uncharacterized protein n=1 Tax=Lichenifustis flavocetrariae TaxID=2949735 RepID=A0AA41YYF4_9HYPH|nr:hypothetical protein [Lichenifustis flavocetrariae]MCW6509373.1 hypothetical protein [Lichenifustis flavocetrariae]